MNEGLVLTLYHVSCSPFYDAFRCLTSTQKQDRIRISDPRLLSFNRIQSRVVTGPLTGNHFLGKTSLHIRADDSPLCRCGAKEEISAHVFFLSVTPWRHSDIPIRTPLSGPRGCRKSKSGRNLGLYVLKEQDSHELDISLRGTEDLSESLRVSGLKGLQIISYFNLFYSILWRAQSLWCI
jgi:hypothetical protein